MDLLIEPEHELRHKRFKVTLRSPGSSSFFNKRVCQAGYTAVAPRKAERTIVAVGEF